MVGGLVRFGTARKWWKKHRSGICVKIWKNITGICVFSLDFGKFWLESGFFHLILEIFGWNLEIFWLVRGFQVLREENRNPTHRNWFLVMKTHHRPTGVVESASFGLDPVGSSGELGTRMNLDSPRLKP